MGNSIINQILGISKEEFPPLSNEDMNAQVLDETGAQVPVEVINDLQEQNETISEANEVSENIENVQELGSDLEEMTQDIEKAEQGEEEISTESLIKYISNLSTHVSNLQGGKIPSSFLANTSFESASSRLEASKKIKVALEGFYNAALEEVFEQKAGTFEKIINWFRTIKNEVKKYDKMSQDLIKKIPTGGTLKEGIEMSVKTETLLTQLPFECLQNITTFYKKSAKRQYLETFKELPSQKYFVQGKSNTIKIKDFAPMCILEFGKDTLSVGCYTNHEEVEKQFMDTVIFEMGPVRKKFASFEEVVDAIYKLRENFLQFSDLLQREFSGAEMWFRKLWAASEDEYEVIDYNAEYSTHRDAKGNITGTSSTAKKLIIENADPDKHIKLFVNSQYLFSAYYYAQAELLNMIK